MRSKDPTDEWVSTHSRLKAAGLGEKQDQLQVFVSTHSRLKAAGIGAYPSSQVGSGFNTQPPEGGWENDSLRC